MDFQSLLSSSKWFSTCRDCFFFSLSSALLWIHVRGVCVNERLWRENYMMDKAENKNRRISREIPGFQTTIQKRFVQDSGAHFCLRPCVVQCPFFCRAIEKKQPLIASWWGMSPKTPLRTPPFLADLKLPGGRNIATLSAMVLWFIKRRFFHHFAEKATITRPQNEMGKTSTHLKITAAHSTCQSLSGFANIDPGYWNLQHQTIAQFSNWELSRS